MAAGDGMRWRAGFSGRIFEFGAEFSKWGGTVKFPVVILGGKSFPPKLFFAPIKKHAVRGAEVEKTSFEEENFPGVTFKVTLGSVSLFGT